MLHKLLSYASLGLALSITCIPGYLHAQDPAFSQFYANRIYLNPAFAGLEKGITLNAAARMQWLNVDQGYKTVGFSADAQLPALRLGVGLHLMRDEAGLSNFTTTQAGAVFSYTIPGPKDNFHFGFEGRIVQRRLDWDKLVFSDQLDPWDGLVGPSELNSVLDQVSFGDMSFGFVWRHEGKIGAGRRAISKVRSHLGMSLHHLPYLINKNLQGNDSFLNSDHRVRPRTTIHGGLIIPMTLLSGTGTEMAISPNFRLDSQGDQFLNFSQNMTVGTVGVFALVNNFHAGLLYQNRFYLPNDIHTDAFILTLGAYTNSGLRKRNNLPPLFLGISMDLNTTGVGPRAGSAFEFTIRYRFMEDARFGLKMRGNSSSRNVMDCKRFF